MARPGIMLYFDILEPIRVLPDADKGRLFVAMLEYGQSGKEPTFDGMLALAWGFVKPKIDKDESEYNMSVLRRQYATTCRERKKKGEPDISFDEWLITIGGHNHCVMQHDHQRSSMIINDDQWYPTTTTPTTTTTKSTTAAAATAWAAAPTAESEMRFVHGELGKGVVLLNEDQTESLLDYMGIDAFDHYVRKLADFIIKNNATVKNHYDTILRWWKEDSGVH